MKSDRSGFDCAATVNNTSYQWHTPAKGIAQRKSYDRSALTDAKFMFPLQ